MTKIIKLKNNYTTIIIFITITFINVPCLRSLILKILIHHYFWLQTPYFPFIISSEKKIYFSLSSIDNRLFFQLVFWLVSIFFNNSILIPFLYNFSLKQAIFKHTGIILDVIAVNSPISIRFSYWFYQIHNSFFIWYIIF